MTLVSLPMPYLKIELENIIDDYAKRSDSEGPQTS